MYNPSLGFTQFYNSGTGLSTINADVIGNVTGQVSDISNHLAADNVFTGSNEFRLGSGSLKIFYDDNTGAQLSVNQFGKVTYTYYDQNGNTSERLYLGNHNTGGTSYSLYAEERPIGSEKGFTGPLRRLVGGTTQMVEVQYFTGTTPSSGTHITISTGLQNKTILNFSAIISDGLAQSLITDIFYTNSTGDLTLHISGSQHNQPYVVKVEYY